MKRFLSTGLVLTLVLVSIVMYIFAIQTDPQERYLYLEKQVAVMSYEGIAELILSTLPKEKSAISMVEHGEKQGALRAWQPELGEFSQRFVGGTYTGELEAVRAAGNEALALYEGCWQGLKDSGGRLAPEELRRLRDAIAAYANGEGAEGVLHLKQLLKKIDMSF